MKYQTTDVWGVKIINTTPHSLTFGIEGQEETIVVEPCGFLLNGKAVEEVCGKEINAADVETTFVKTRFVKNREGIKFLQDAPAQTVIVGSIIAAQAYQGQVCAMIPVPGFERVPPAEKRMRHDKFTIF
jgi:hypothetical protein